MSTPIPAKALPTIDPARCTGCGRCVAICPPGVLWLEASGAHGWGPKQAVLHDPPHCTGCAKCALACPFDAIGMVKTVADARGAKLPADRC